MKRRAWVWMGLCLGLSACTRVGTRPAGRPDPVSPSDTTSVAAPRDGRYTGFATLSGRRVPVFLELHPGQGDHVAATLGIPELDLEATGEGRWEDGELSLLLRYGERTCVGESRVRVSPVGSLRLNGTLEAEDCTGRAQGPLDLARRDG